MARRKILTAVAALLFGVGSTASAQPVFNTDPVNLSAGVWSIRNDVDAKTNEDFFFDQWIMQSSGTLQVTDLFVIGDEFEVYKNGFSMGLTSPSAYDAGVYTLDADAAWGDAQFSKGSFGVSATDIITIRATAYPPGYNDATVAVRLVTVPEPGSVFLLAAGLLALGVVARRRRA